MCVRLSRGTCYVVVVKDFIQLGSAKTYRTYIGPSLILNAIAKTFALPIQILMVIGVDEYMVGLGIFAIRKTLASAKRPANRTEWMDVVQSTSSQLSMTVSYAVVIR
jgi:hypothetical protein